MKWQRLPGFAGLLTAGIALTGCSSGNLPPEPSYDGKSLSAWIIEASTVPDDQDPAVDAIEKMGGAALPHLLAAFKTGRLSTPQASGRKLQVWEVRTHVAQIMKGLGTNAAPLAYELTEYLGHREERVREEAAEILGHTGVLNEKVLKGLLRTLGDSQCGFQASRSLARLGKKHTNVVYELMTVTKGENRTAAEWATVGLVNLGAKAAPALQVLIELTQDSSFGIRVGAVQTIALIEPKDEVAISALIRALRDKEVWVRKSAVIALGRIGQPARSCIGELKVLLEKNEPAYTKADIARALWRIQPEQPLLPLQIAEGLVRKTLEEMDRGEGPGGDLNSALFLLAEMGTNATSALPIVLRAQEVNEPTIQFNAAWAACHVDPGQRAQAEDVFAKIADLESHALDPNLQSGGPVGQILAGPKRQRESYHIRLAAIGALRQLDPPWKAKLGQDLAGLLKEWTHWTSLRSPIPELQVLLPVLREILDDPSMAEIQPFAAKALDSISGSDGERW